MPRISLSLMTISGHDHLLFFDFFARQAFDAHRLIFDVCPFIPSRLGASPPEARLTIESPFATIQMFI